jgi:2-isopropylmalate synthase
VDAIIHGYREPTPIRPPSSCSRSARDQGTDAQAQVSVRLEEDGRTVTGKASDTDTMVAAAYAYVNALNKLLVKREKRAPEALTIAR